jgi:hypothetical protein
MAQTQTLGGWQRRIEKTLGANSVGCAELQPNLYLKYQQAYHQANLKSP